MLSDERYCEQEISSKTVIEKEVLRNNRTLNGGFNMELKKRSIKIHVWNGVMYTSETWTMTQTEMNHMEAFEILICRRVLKISWKDKATNTEILRRVNDKRDILDAKKEKV